MSERVGSARTEAIDGQPRVANHPGAMSHGYPESLAWLEPQLPRVTLPTRIFWGDVDKLLFVDNGSRLAEVLPNASLTILPNCGHFSYQDQSDRFARMVREWVLAHE